MDGFGGGGGTGCPGMGGSRLTGLDCVGEVTTGVGSILGDDGRPTGGAVGGGGVSVRGRWVGGGEGSPAGFDVRLIDL